MFCVTVLFGSYLPDPSIQRARHRDGGVHGPHGVEQEVTRGGVDFLKIEVVHSILFTINLIFKLIFDRTGPDESFTFLYPEIYCSIFVGMIKQHCFSFR